MKTAQVLVDCRQLADFVSVRPKTRRSADPQKIPVSGHPSGCNRGTDVTESLRESSKGAAAVGDVTGSIAQFAERLFDRPN